MKKLIYCLLAFLASLPAAAQHVYQIRADSVRIYNVCDTAELIIENRTRGVAGFLYNKGNGRTEFKKLRLETIGNNQIAITGQDTLDISALPGIGGVDTIYRDGDYIKYTKRGITHPIYLPESYYEIPSGQAYEPAAFAVNRVSGFGAYGSPDMPLRAGSPAYYAGHVVWNGNFGYQMAVNWDGELNGPQGVFIRNKDDTKTTWGAWRSLLFRDDADNVYAPKSHTHEGQYYTIAQLQTTGQSQVQWGNITGAPSFSNYYTIGNLQTPGQAQVHWNNITGAPDFTANETLQTITDRGNTTTQNISAANVLWTGINNGNPRSLKIGYSGGDYGSIGYGLDFTSSSNVFNYSPGTNGDHPTLLRFTQGFDFLTASGGTAGNTITFTRLAEFKAHHANFFAPLLQNGYTVWHAGNHGAGSGLNADLLDGYSTSAASSAATIPVRDQSGYIYANYYHTAAENESLTPTRIYGSNDGFIRPLNAGSVRSFLGIPGGGETLQSVADRGNTISRDIFFNGGNGNPSNGLVWNYNTDIWKIFVESPTDTPSGNLVFESHDNSDEGWIFRNVGADVTPVASDILSFNRNRFKYLNKDVWHGGNLFRPMGQHYERLHTADNTSANDFQQGTTFSYAAGSPYFGPLLSFGGLNGGYDCQFNASYIGGTDLSFRTRNGDAQAWNDWRTIWHSGNITFNTKGNDIALKTESSGYLGLDSWVRVGDLAGLFTASGRYLYNNNSGSWAIRGNPGEAWLELQTHDGANRGGLYANATNDVGIVNAGANGWRLRTDVSGNAYVTGQVQATSFYQSSLRSLKRDIQPFTASGLDVLRKAQVRSFIFKADNTNKMNIGFIADEVPDEMSTPGRQGVDQASTVALLVKSVQELEEKIKKLEGMIVELSREKTDKK